MSRPTKLSDKELLRRLKARVRREREAVVDILIDLGEVDRRRLYLELGHASLFDYCTGGLFYSASAAGRRVQVARALRRFPEIAPMLHSGDANLSTIGIVSPVLREANKTTILTSIRGKSQREVEAIAARYRGPVVVRDRVKPVCVAAPVGHVSESASGASLEVTTHLCASPGASVDHGEGQLSVMENRTSVSSYSRSDGMDSSRD